MPKIMTTGFTLALAVMLSACGSTPLLSNSTPDEMAVVDGPPLTLPPDFDLRRPVFSAVAAILPEGLPDARPPPAVHAKRDRGSNALGLRHEGGEGGGEGLALPAEFLGGGLAHGVSRSPPRRGR